MDSENDKNLFEIRINDFSKKTIRKIFPLVSISFIATILLAIIMTAISLYGITKYHRTAGGSIPQWYLFLYPFYSIFYAIIGVVGGYFYFLFIKFIKKAVVNSDETMFNSAFKYGYINSVLFIIAIFISLLFAVFQIVVIFS